MIGLGTLVNCGTVIVGTTIGLVLKGGLPERFEKTIMSALGLCAFFIGIGGALENMLVIENGAISTQYTMLLVLCMAIGAIIGEWMNIELRLEQFGDWCKSKFRVSGKNSATFVDGFVSSSLLFCVGAMTIVGSLEDGLNGNYTILFAKSIMDGVAAIVFSASLGIGVYLSCLTLLVYQGGITLLAGFIRPFLTDQLIGQMSFVGSVLIFAIGFNLAFGKKFKVGNLLPAMFLPILFLAIKTVFPGFPI